MRNDGKNNLVPGDKVSNIYLVPNESYEQNNLAVKGLNRLKSNFEVHTLTAKNG